MPEPSLSSSSSSSNHRQQQRQPPESNQQPSETEEQEQPASWSTTNNGFQITWEPLVAQQLRNMQMERQPPKNNAHHHHPQRPLLVGLVGIPGSGKSTSAQLLADLLCSTSDNHNDTMILPADGFHIPLAQLPNADAVYRRGAPDTFDAAQLQRALQRMIQSEEHDNESSIVTLPGFDHAVGDPVPHQHVFVRSQHRIVICEGLYLLHDTDGWEHIQQYLDWSIYIDANIDLCMERLKERNKCIPGYTPEEIALRVEVVDRVNAETARRSAMKYASQRVLSAGAAPAPDE